LQEFSDTSEGFEEEDGLASEPAVYRLMGSLGGKAMMPVALRVVPEWLGAADWRMRRVGLVVVAALADQCSKQAGAQLGQMVRSAVASMRDPHPRVAAQALHLLNALCTAFPERVPLEHHAEVVPALGSLLADQAQARPSSFKVRGIAVAALVVLAGDRCPAEALAPYLDPLLSGLISCLQPNAPPQLQEVALEGQSVSQAVMPARWSRTPPSPADWPHPSCAVSCSVVVGCCAAVLAAVTNLASVSQADFSGHYAAFMPGLKGILGSPAAAQQPSLRDRAVQCIGVLGGAVGRQAFLPDAAEVMGALAAELAQAQAQAQGEGEVSWDRLGPATGAICAAMRGDFAQYLPVLLPVLARAATADVGFCVQDLDDEEADTGMQHDEATGLQTAVVDVRGHGKKRITMNTFAVLEKAAALDTMDKYARELGWRFAECVMEGGLSGLALPLVDFKFSEQVRTSAAIALSSFFDCVVAAARRGELEDLQVSSSTSQGCDLIPSGD
jgi:GAF domain-containing protein